MDSFKGLLFCPPYLLAHVHDLLTHKELVGNLELVMLTVESVHAVMDTTPSCP